MPRTILLLTLVVISVPVRADDPAPVTVRVVAPDGNAAAGAKVWVLAPDAPREPAPIIADERGMVRVPADSDARRGRDLLARDSGGRIGWARIAPLEYALDGHAAVTVRLLDTARRAGRLTAADGTPVAGAEVVPFAYEIERGPAATPEAPASLDVPEWDQARSAATTDADGRFVVAVPSGCSLYYRVKAAGRGETRWTAPATGGLDTKLYSSGTVVVTFAGVNPALLAGMDWHLAPTDTGAARTPGVRPMTYRSGQLDGTGSLTITDVLPGRYEFQVWPSATVPAVFEKPVPFDVAEGRTAAVAAKFGAAATATGVITDKATGKGVAGVSLWVSVTDVGRQPRATLSAKTDKDGRYTAHGPAGWYSVWVQTAPDGYSMPPRSGPRGVLVEPARVEAGESHTFPAIALPAAVTLSGRAVLPGGRPAAGATVRLHSDGFSGIREAPVTADRDGRFVIRNLPPDDGVAPRVRLGKAVNVPQTVELGTTGPVTVELSEASAAGFTGRVLGATGKPVAGARVTLFHTVPLVGRTAMSGVVYPRAVATTDGDGRYTFAGLWPKDQYHVQAAGDGFARAEGKRLVGAAGEVQEFPPLTIARSALTVRGAVVGANGKPVAGAEVFAVDGPRRVATASAADGTFALSGFNEGAAFVFARTTGHRLAAVPVTAGTSDRVAITLTASGAPPAAAPVVPPQHRAALDRLTRHVLNQIWESHPTFGFGHVAIRGMAHIDLDAAKRWRNEEKTRTDGKADFTATIDREVRARTLFATAKEDVEEALAVIRPLKPDTGFDEAYRLGGRLLAVDRAKAARLAEEAVLKARQRDMPARAWALAQAGELAVRSGSEAGGKKVLFEAADLAARLGERGQDTLAVGMVAARLAPHDWARAEAMLASLKDPSEYNRHLRAAAGRLAATDLPTAKQLFDRFKPDNAYYAHEARLRAAYAVARDRPDEAAALVDGVTLEYYRVRGHYRLAALFAAADPARAARMIDGAFDLLERDPSPYSSWSSYGGRAGLAAVGLVRAKEIGHPDLAGLVARALAMRPTGQENWSPDAREQTTVNFAAVLALIDPAAARHVLATVAPPDDLVARAMSKQRDWLFAVALADPERGVALAGKLMERAKSSGQGRNALSATGLVELTSILTADDRLAALAMFGNLPRELGDED